MQIGLVWLLIQAIWSGEVSSVSIIVIGLVQVWSGFQTFSTLTHRRFLNYQYSSFQGVNLENHNRVLSSAVSLIAGKFQRVT